MGRDHWNSSGPWDVWSQKELERVNYCLICTAKQKILFKGKDLCSELQPNFFFPFLLPETSISNVMKAIFIAFLFSQTCTLFTFFFHKPMISVACTFLYADPNGSGNCLGTPDCPALLNNVIPFLGSLGICGIRLSSGTHILSSEIRVIAPNYFLEGEIT